MTLKKLAVPFLLFFSMCLVSSSLFANVEQQTKTMELNYDGFFDRMDDLDEAEYVDIKLAFYFNQINSKKACPIRSAKLQTKIKSMPVYYLENGEVLLPFDEQLDMDKAKLVIETEKGLECGLNMRLENSFLLASTIDNTKLVRLVETFNDALQDLGGMMSFLVPKVTGVTVLGKTGEQLSIINGDESWCSDNQCILTSAILKNAEKPFVLSSIPSKIVPFIKP
ncbi:DUF2987 domain-containing protein [Psychrosphaera sp. B3R10]|uniref:DUF2987 domain-containing protein n=1 Tax=unclassified Psychrosphaera TaxID=2641570 RepID=UPI001C098B8B|nr:MULTISPECIES: DUF2987 domain-containing protein [unclassified Psychrosphaera]MBU2882364.1 DUF2987 domain-containing protein [Psychrosphaera sp. I2R16]MBU2989045.1 DUF2987 domain-containing protein [Psychrosphaera sp. B3R10]